MRDLRDLPVRLESLDLVYSFGVLHHLDRTGDVIRHLYAALRPGGALLLYLYYALDNRSRYFQMLFWVVDVVRRFSSLLPQALLGPFATLIAACVYLPLARTARALERAGLGRVASSIPLSFYANLSFETMRNDSLDRFGTRLEKRYTRLQVRRLLEQVGLRAVTIAPSAPYWHGIGIKPRSQDLADEFPALLAER